MSDALEETIVHREIDVDEGEAAAEIAMHVADLEGREMAEMTNMWECTNDVLQHMLSEPPRPQAQMQVEFSYENYRITVHQDGVTEFVKVG